MNRSPLALLLSPAVLLGACGGGSDGGPLPVDFATITTDNAPAVAAAVVSSAFRGDGLGDFAWLMAAGDPVTSGQTAVLTKSGGAAVLAKGVLEQSRAVLQAPIAPTTSPCAVGGTIELSGDIATTQTLTAGDTITFVFTECDDGVSIVSGTFSMTITSFAGDFVGGSFAFGVDATVEAFSISVGGEAAASLDGEVSMSLDVTSAPSLVLTVESTSLSIGDAAATHTFENYSLIETSDSVTGAYTVLVSGRLSSSSFEGVVDFETTAAFESADGGPAFAGSLEISGEGGASITVTFLDATSVRLEVDEDNDGTVDAVIDTTRDALVSA